MSKALQCLYVLCSMALIAVFSIFVGWGIVGLLLGGPIGLLLFSLTIGALAGLMGEYLATAKQASAKKRETAP